MRQDEKLQAMYVIRRKNAELRGTVEIRSAELQPLRRCAMLCFSLLARKFLVPSSSLAVGTRFLIKIITPRFTQQDGAAAPPGSDAKLSPIYDVIFSPKIIPPKLTAKIPMGSSSSTIFKTKQLPP